MKKKITILLTILAATFAVHVHSLDGIHGNLLALSQTDTEYSENYSDAAFRTIKTGQTKESVIEALGQPISINQIKRKDKKNQELLWYSHSPSGSSYRLRTIEFVDGIVSEVTSHYYID